MKPKLDNLKKTKISSAYLYFGLHFLLVAVYFFARLMWYVITDEDFSRIGAYLLGGIIFFMIGITIYNLLFNTAVAYLVDGKLMIKRPLRPRSYYDIDQIDSIDNYSKTKLKTGRIYNLRRLIPLPNATPSIFFWLETVQYTTLTMRTKEKKLKKYRIISFTFPVYSTVDFYEIIEQVRELYLEIPADEIADRLTFPKYRD